MPMESSLIGILWLLASSVLVFQVKAQDCILQVPDQPLTAKGLSTPFRIVTAACTQTDPNLASFVEATILDLDTGQLSVYSPLVVDLNAQVAVNPVVPQLPIHSVVGLWFGTNGNSLTLVGQTNTTLTAAHCVNGLPHSIFGQFAYCNALEFFLAADALVLEGKLRIPPLGNTSLGDSCPTTRSFGVVDQDQSDNVVSTYLLTADGQLAQNTAANRAKFPTATVLSNGSDNLLLNGFMLPALGCKPFAVPDLADPTVMRPSLATDELHASLMGFGPSVALVPQSDPMVLVQGKFDIAKTNLYRIGVNQPIAIGNGGSPLNYCQEFRTVGSSFLKAHSAALANGISPDPSTGINLLDFLGSRYVASYSTLNCPELLNLSCPLSLVLNDQGAVQSVIFLN